ncbi:MAG: FAD-dependent oxidoreductase [Deltaproteobacteria bacterium]|nr:FAD-dependent oxidoreductase [Deltaproteobacteria bacterium]
MRISQRLELPLYGLITLILFVGACGSPAAWGAPARAAGFPVKIRGSGETSFTPVIPKGSTVTDPVRYDAIVVGGGLAGMTSALYLTDRGKKVLILEKEEALGGLAFGGNLPDGVPFNRGGSYWAAPYEEEEKILEHIGLGNFSELYTIHEPIDSYLWNGKFYPGIWEEETVEKLPASFALFKHELKLADKAGLIPNQPFEEQNLELDAMNAAEWIRKMPSIAAARDDDESRKIHERFRKDPSIKPADPMGDVIGLMDLFCRSALGTTTERVSATAFANFYISEIEPRYSGPKGTGQATKLLENILAERKHLAKVRLKATVTKIRQTKQGVKVEYVFGGRRHEASGDYAVFAAQLKFAPRIIDELSKNDPDRVKAIEETDYAHYSVHVAFVKGHPFRATYDTWTRAADYSPQDFTDVILGRWMDPAIRGYEGMRDFAKSPADDRGILLIYHPFHLASELKRSKAMTKEHAVLVARQAVGRMLEIYSPFLKKTWGTKIDVTSVETNTWPYSIHIAKPGHFTRLARLLRKPFGRVFFANNNVGTPSFEEALFRGHCAANNVLKRTVDGFANEAWSRCPLE